MQDIINQFIDVMRKAGCSPANSNDIVADGKDHYTRLEGDKRDKRLGYCLTIENDGFAYGNFINFKTSDKGKWNSKKSDKGLSDEERTEIHRRVKEAEDRKEAEREAEHETSAIEAARIWNDADPVLEHDYLTRKGIDAHGVRVSGDSLVISGSNSGKIWTIQYIEPDGEKKYLYGARKQGCYYKIAGNDDVICIVEGFATGASVKQATGFTVYVAFDSGNLVPVAIEVKKLHPKSRIIFCADNDHETMIKGKPHNTGIIQANQAAVKIGGAPVIHPEFKPEDAAGNSDFNDMHKLYGLDAVKDRILSVKTDRGGDAKLPSVQTESAAAPTNSETIVINGADKGDFGMPFKVLGYKDGNYYYYSFSKREIIRLNAGAHTLMNLMQLADLDKWENMFIKEQQSKIPVLAANRLFLLANERGYFKEEDRIRGTGVWKDAGRIIVNCGNKIYVDGVETQFDDIVTGYVYVTGANIPALYNGEINKDFIKLRDIFSRPTWESPASGVLVAGWIVIAPLCSALSFRPHIFITGQAESGKSTIIGFIKQALHGISLNTDGTSSEASIRSAMGYNARPIIFDEAEGRGSAVTSMDAVLSLARMASTGGTVMKFGQREFKAQSPFCFSAINPPIKNSADESRISKMVIKKNRKPDAARHFRELVDIADDTLTPDFAKQLMTYTVRNIKTVMKNVEILQVLLREHLKAPRAAQQISHMLAGYYLLESAEVLTQEKAMELVLLHDWSDHTAVCEESDPEKLIHHIALSLVKVSPMSGNTREVTIGDLVSSAVGKSSMVGTDMANDVLKHYSMRVEPTGLYIGYKNDNLKKLLRDTDWCAGWSRTLSDLDGCERISIKYFSAGDKQRCVRVPLKYFIDMEDEEEVQEIPFD